MPNITGYTSSLLTYRFVLYIAAFLSNCYLICIPNPTFWRAVLSDVSCLALDSIFNNIFDSVLVFIFSSFIFVQVFDHLLRIVFPNPTEALTQSTCWTDGLVATEFGQSQGTLIKHCLITDSESRPWQHFSAFLKSSSLLRAALLNSHHSVSSRDGVHLCCVLLHANTRPLCFSHLFHHLARESQN